MIDIMIGIPALNEEDSIANVVTQVDLGLKKYFPNCSSIIVNISSGSKDNTINVFKTTKTYSNKVNLYPKHKLRGKGWNILKMIDFAIKHNVKYLVFVDSDLMSIKPNWMYKLIKPIKINEADFVIPLYKRNRYEGSTTNHFCVPVLKHYLKLETPIRQPIGGEFAFNLKFAKKIGKTKKHPNVYKYGVDIFLTFLALRCGCRIKQVTLGQKKHKPSFEKMIPMFKQVCCTLLWLINQYPASLKNKSIVLNSGQSSISNEYLKPTKNLILKRKREILNLIDKINNNNLPKTLSMNINNIKRDINVPKEKWLGILFDFCNHAITLKDRGVLSNINTLSKAFTPIFLARVLTFYDEIEGKSAKYIEKLIEYNS